MKFLTFFSTVCMTVVGGALASSLTSCDCHHFEEPEQEMRVGDILCTDGCVVTFDEYVSSGREAIAIVYNVNPDRDEEIRGYAVYLEDISDEAFADNTPGSQGTSCEINSIDGNENTYALFKCEETGSPMAQPVFDLWAFGQSAYIPSVEQLRQVQSVKNIINPRIEAIGGDRIPDSPYDCWYWSSTEVEGQSDIKAWLVSMNSGIIQETPKEQKHHCRPVVTIYRHNKDNYEDDYSDELNKFRIDTTVKLSIDRKMSDYKAVDSTLFVTRASVDWGMRYIVAAYRLNETVPYDIKSSYDAEVNFSLPPGKYNFVGWADPVPHYDNRSYFFYTDDFSELMWRHKYDYIGNDLGKCAYRNKSEFRVSFSSKEFEIVLHPAVGRYRLIATDTCNYTPGKVLLSYYDLPSSINGLTGDINNYWYDVSYLSHVSKDLLALDNVFSSPKETSVTLCVEIYDDRDNLRSRVRKVTIPLVNGGITTLKGNFFSTLQLDGNSSNGGIIIDPEFEETVEIEY